MKTDQNSNMQGTLNKRISMKKRRNAKRALLALNLVAVIFTTTVFSNPVSVLSEEVSTDAVQSIENSPGTDAQIAEQADVQQNTAEAAQAAEAPAEEDMEAEVPSSAAMPAVTFDQKVNTENGTVMVHVDAEEGAFEDGTSMAVTPVTRQDILDKAIDAAGGKGAAAAMDITFTKPNGTKTEPLKPIHVKMISPVLNRAEEAYVVHVTDSGSTDVVAKKSDGKTIESTSNDATSSDGKNAVSFESDSFSVYAIVYTVDFHWEVNGKKFEFTIPGGGFVSFTDLVEVLGIADDTNDGENSGENGSAALSLDNVAVSEATREFVADVASLEFSNPELVDVSKVISDTTVGEIKENRGLECRYSAELTEEQINRINNSAVGNGDWALISMRPFASEETLTVTMKNEEQFVIKVTDAQIHTYVISDSGDTYKITVTYDDKTGIPADAELRAHLLTPEDERYQEDIDRSNAALLARYDHEAINPLVFEIKIFAGGKEIEPLEGTQVNVEISLAMDMVSGQPQAEGEDIEAEASDMTEDEESDEDSLEDKAEEGSLLIDGVEYTIEPTEVDLSDTKVIHMTDDGKTEVIEDLNSMVDTDNNVVVTFETGSFSDYMLQGVYDNNGLNGLPDVIYVGDEIYMQNCPNIWCTNIGSVVSETKYDGDGYKSVRATDTGSFKLTYVQNTNNPGNWWNNSGKTITVLPARSEGNNGQPYAGTTPPATIPTVSNASIGLTLNLFDYDLDEYLDNRFNNKDYGDHLNNFKNRGINSGHSLKFWGSGITDSSYGAQNNYVEHGVTSIVNSNLSGGYPTLRSDNTSLDYLFTPSDGTDKTAYLNVDGLFKKDGDYYVYNSNENYAWYNPATNKFEVYNSTYKQKSRHDGGEQATQTVDKAIGFFPFHPWDDQYDLYVNWNKNLNHHFGMSMSVPFSLPKNPKAVVDTNGDPIIFEFSGDDDLWVFIDGKLAMDIGGIHQPTTGTINFQTGVVTANGQTQLAANQFNNRFPNLYDGNPHTLQVFYIERGGCDSNCKIMFNMTLYGDIHFDKVDKDNPSDKLAGAVFGIYKDEACTQPLMENLNNNTSRAYVAESDANGRVQFSDIPIGTYYLKELNAPEGYPLDNTVHTVQVFYDQAAQQVKVKVTIDGMAVENGVKITNKKPVPITLGLQKEWQNEAGGTIAAPAGAEATFKIKRIRNYETYTEQAIEGQGREVSHLTVGWIHNGQMHVHGEYDLIVGTTATVSWGYNTGYTGSKDCIVNGTRIDKDYVTGNVISEALTMPAAGQTATIYIVDESENGEAIRSINVVGSQFYGNSGGGVIHTFTTHTEPDPDFSYTGDHVTDNQVTLPIDPNTWSYDFTNLPTFERGSVEGVDHPVSFNYTYYLEEVSNTAPAGTTVVYKDLNGNVINSPTDAETSTSGTQTITNRIPFGYLQIEKQVTYNGSSENLTSAQKSKLAGEYKFKIYTTEQCTDADAVQDPNAAVDAEDKDLIITITIGEDGQAVSSGPIKLLAGNYWIKEVETSNPAMFPVENPIAVTVTKDDTTNNPVIKSLTNNYDENNGPDKISLDIEKIFSGLGAASQVPPNFQVILQYKVGGQTKTVTLHNTELVTGENGEKITWSQSTDRFTWHWSVSNIPSEATDFELKEINYDNAKGFDWKSASLNGTDITATVTSWHDLVVTAPAAVLSDVTNDRRTSDSGSNTVFYLEDDDILLSKLTANQGTLVISKYPLNLAERDAVVKGWPSQGGFKTPPHYFSIEEHPNGFSYGDKTVTFGEKNGRTIVKFTQNASAQEDVFTVSYSSEEARNNANLLNTYEEVPITIDIVKVDKNNNTVKLPDAVFTIRQLADVPPTANGTLTTLNGTMPTDSLPTDANGKTSFGNLTHGYYEITEKTPPRGYVMTDETTFYFEIDSGEVKWLEKGTGKPSTWTVKSSSDMVSFEAAHAAVAADPDNDVEAAPATNAVFTVENEPGAALPHTGGPGTRLFTILGSILIFGAGVLLWRRRRLI